jgi:F0F1-type ATP synthase epsilon subunit
VQAAGRTHAFRVRGGFLQVIDNHVRIVAEQVDEGA